VLRLGPPLPRSVRILRIFPSSSYFLRYLGLQTCSAERLHSSIALIARLQHAGFPVASQEQAYERQNGSSIPNRAENDKKRCYRPRSSDDIAGESFPGTPQVRCGAVRCGAEEYVSAGCRLVARFPFFCLLLVLHTTETNNLFICMLCFPFLSLAAPLE